MILVNFKIYKETFGDGAIRLAKICKKVADVTRRRVVVAATGLDAVRIKEETGIEVWLQHVDEYVEGRKTGWVSAGQAVELGIKGSLVNHFERQIPQGTVRKIVKHKPEGFETCVCVKSLGQIERWAAKLKPDYILFEPPELIASKEASVATMASESIRKAVELSGTIPLIVGAGVKEKRDVEISLKMGAKAVGLASGFVLSPNPEKVLMDIAEGFVSV